MLVSNAGQDDHSAAIAALLAWGSEITIAVAFLKTSGANHVASVLKPRLASGAEVEIFVGTDFFLTEPDALERLLELRRHGSLRISVADRSSATFHPKMYSARNGIKVKTLVGSANLTGGAMGSNEELSLRIDHEVGDDLARQIDVTIQRYRSSARFQALDPLVLQQYRSAYEIDQRERAEYERRRDEALPNALDLRVIDQWHTLYLADPEAMTGLEYRRARRAEALQAQRSIAAMAGKPIDRRAKAAFRVLLGDLMGRAGGRHLWLSGNIPRQGSKALEHPDDVIALFALARRQGRRSPRQGYDAIRRAANAIPGVGINMATEILCTFAPSRYAVYNGNTVGALTTLGITAPSRANFHAISPAKYDGLCQAIGALAVRIRAADLSEADAFLNWIYWEVKAGRHP